jgi:DNA primase
MDIQELKKLVPIDLLLEHYGMYDISYRDGWQSVNCVFHDDETASAAVNLLEDRFVCYACGVKGDILDIVQEVERVADVREAMTWVEDHLV